MTPPSPEQEAVNEEAMRCSANRLARRCELPEGHPKRHMINLGNDTTMEWDDF